MTITTATTTPLQAVSFDLYRDIHKGIRNDLFAVTYSAGRLDPTSVEDRGALAHHLSDVVELLVTHAEHEDAHIQPVVERELPDVAERIAEDHESLETRIVDVARLADDLAALRDNERFAAHEVYLELASFTGAYLAHQDYEERIVMPALDALLGFEGLLPIHGAIVGSIPPEQMAKSLSLMLPAMNVDDRTDLLGALKANAPAAVFEGVWRFAGSVLTAAERDAVARRLGL